MSALPVMAVDTLDDTSGTGDLQDRWTLVGNPSDFQVGSINRTPCFGIRGKQVCICRRMRTTLPQACITAAAAEPNGPGGTTGLRN